MLADEDATSDEPPTAEDMLVAVIDTLLPDRRPRYRVRRILNLGSSGRVPSFNELEQAVAALAQETADAHVDLNVVLKLLEASKDHRSTGRDEALRAGIVKHVERRWSYFEAALAAYAAQRHLGYSLFEHFPRLADEPLFIARLADELKGTNRQNLWLEDLLSQLAVKTKAQARTLIAAIGGRDERNVATCLFAAIGRGVGWTPWTVLMAILRVRPEYAEPYAAFEIPKLQSDSRLLVSARDEMARAIEGQTKVRALAVMLLELVQHRPGYGETDLLSRPAETRAAYVDSLQELIGDDADLRQAAIEALLWWPSGQAADLAQFAAVALVHADDREFLIELESHPVDLVRYAARAVRAAKFSDLPMATVLPSTNSLVGSLVTLESGTPDTGEFPRTWLGDRNIERLIEHTISRVEAHVASEYDAHGDEGEDRLLATLFRDLSTRFSALDDTLEALARASAAPHRASVSMRYRNVDRPEEGRKGIKGAKSFSADLCLIVDPMLDGISLGRRVTLIQAKRLYRNRRAKVQPTWQTSFALHREQRLALQAQTDSSVYFFLAPPLFGRGVPVIPTQLVADLSEHRGSGTRLRKEVVATASRSLADWLTYDALALRVGDPYDALVEKAEGRPGCLPRRLLELPTVEVQVGITPRSGDR
ncbi:hypothetical protein [Sphingomonas sp. G-3-2-10]|uniref:hypothetical protein n=1 Tax=Sphingomonas sp. G-3-2-10 TaxID=2728838 RepID=UPI00146E43BD|nr:hypothetical protein [Sphingomonas sp. G-3-2-10]NML06743.1 hypothetical protein [Sphingomonas sp. G-3-2-10]